MPRYRNADGVVVDIPEEKAARMGGFTPIEPPPAPARRGRPPKVEQSETPE